MKNNWTGLKNKLSMVGGKEFVKCLNKQFRKKYNKGLTIPKIISEFQKEEFDDEIVNVITEIC